MRNSYHGRSAVNDDVPHMLARAKAEAEYSKDVRFFTQSDPMLDLVSARECELNHIRGQRARDRLPPVDEKPQAPRTPVSHSIPRPAGDTRLMSKIGKINSRGGKRLGNPYWENHRGTTAGLKRYW